MITAVEEETKKSTRQRQYVWEATWKHSEQDARVQLVSAPDLRRARLKAEKHQEEKQFDGELVSLVRREDIIL